MMEMCREYNYRRLKCVAKSVAAAQPSSAASERASVQHGREHNIQQKRSSLASKNAEATVFLHENFDFLKVKHRISH